MSKKGQSSQSSQAPVIIQQAAPQVIEFSMPSLPPMPSLPDLQLPSIPTPTYIAPYDSSVEDAANAAKAAADVKARNQLRAGRSSTILTSPLGVTEEAEIKKQNLLGG